MADTFGELVDRLVRDRFGTAAALAEAINLSHSAFSRGVHAGTLSTLNLLRLAAAAELSPSEVLRSAKKGDIADLIETLYGAPKRVHDETAQRVLAMLEGLSAEQRAALEAMLRAFKATEEGPPRSVRRAGAARRRSA